MLKNNILCNHYPFFGSNLIEKTDHFLDYALFAIFVLYLYQGGPIEAGVLAVCFTLPFIVLSKKIGKFVDLSKPRKTFLSGSLLTIIGCVLLLFSTHLVWVYCAALIKTVGRIFIGISVPKYTTHVFKKKDYKQVNSFITTSANIGKVFGPALCTAGLLVLSETSLVYISLALCLATFLAYTKISHDFIDEEQNQNHNADNFVKPENFSKWYHLISSYPILKIGLIAYVCAQTSVYISDDLLALLFKKSGGSEQSIGIMIAIIGLGGVCGGFISKYGSNPSKLFLLSLIIDTLVFNIYGWFLHLHIFDHLLIPTFMTVCFIMGIGTGLGAVGFQTLLQENVNKKIIGITTGYLRTLIASVALIGPMAGALIAELSTIHLPFKISGVFLLAVTAYSAHHLAPFSYNKNQHKNKNKEIEHEKT